MFPELYILRNQLRKLLVKLLVAVRHLQGAKDGIFRVLLCGGNKRFKGSGGKPCILVQEVNVVVAMLQGILNAKVVSL
ncbi:MAG: hypothetical protein J6U34_06185 [Bacteroidales bacterium]|nr:hypothetical protein [Bacteroidales bacterium]